MVVGWSPRRTRLSFPRKRESRGTGREPGAATLGGTPHVCLRGRRKNHGFPLTTCGNDRGGRAGMMEGTGGNDEVTGEKDGRGPTGVTEGAGVVVG